MERKYYTADEVVKILLEDPCAQTADGRLNCYKSAAVNYRSLTKGTPRRLVTEVLSAWICANFKKYRREMFVCTRGAKSRGAVYRQVDAKGRDLHDGRAPDGPSPRAEDRIAMTFKGRSFRSIGKVLDYQVPLKDRQSDEMGKIDLVSYDKRTNRLFLLELKDISNKKETLLRCLLEAYAYSRSLDRSAFSAEYGIPSDCKTVLCPLYFAGSRLEKDRNEMRAGKRPAYASLVAKICDVEGFDVEFAKILDDEILFD